MCIGNGQIKATLPEVENWRKIHLVWIPKRPESFESKSRADRLKSKTNGTRSQLVVAKVPWRAQRRCVPAPIKQTRRAIVVSAVSKFDLQLEEPTMINLWPLNDALYVCDLLLRLAVPLVASVHISIMSGFVFGASTALWTWTPTWPSTRTSTWTSTWTREESNFSCSLCHPSNRHTDLHLAPFGIFGSRKTTTRAVKFCQS